MKTIPRFTHEETAEIEKLLIDEGIPFDSEAVNLDVGPHGAATGYLFIVEDDSYDVAIRLIREYFGLNEPAGCEAYSGMCPACNTNVLIQRECPECGLSFTFSPGDAMKSHPFYIYLKQQGKLTEPRGVKKLSGRC